MGVIPLHERPLFTYSLRGLPGAFLRLCRRLNIDNLHFHDLRHEATSRLFEKGLNPVEVATITGHKDTRMLMRYTHLRAEDLDEYRKASWSIRMSTEESQRHMLGTKIWVDADACPNAIKEILYRVADRIPVMVTLVANQALQIPRSSYIRTVQVPSGFDVADNHIVEKSKPGDLVITADIPLAAELTPRGRIVLNPRGELYSEENIRERLNMRDFLDTLRGSGVTTGGPAPFSQTDRMAFANQLDRLLAR